MRRFAVNGDLPTIFARRRLGMACALGIRGWIHVVRRPVRLQQIVLGFLGTTTSGDHGSPNFWWSTRTQGAVLPEADMTLITEQQAFCM